MINDERAIKLKLYIIFYLKKFTKKIRTFLIFNIITSIVYPFISAKIIVNLTDNKLEQFVFMGLVFLSICLIGDTISYIKSRLYEKIFRQIYINIQFNLGASLNSIGYKCFAITKIKEIEILKQIIKKLEL